MNLFHWLSGQDVLSSGGTMNSPRDMLWSWITIILSGAIIAGYSVIAFNWYFQSKLARHADAANALRRLRNISVACAGCGLAFFLLDIPFFVWRLYDLVLVLLVIYTWGFLLKMRGLSLVDERLAQLNELEKSARKYQEIAELLPHIVWTATADGHIDFSNQSWRDYAGGRIEQQTWLDVVHPDQRDHANQRWREALEAQQPLSLELRLRCATGATSHGAAAACGSRCARCAGLPGGRMERGCWRLATEGARWCRTAARWTMSTRARSRTCVAPRGRPMARRRCWRATGARCSGFAGRP